LAVLVKNKSWQYSFADVRIFPADGLGTLGILTDIAHDLAGEVVDSGEIPLAITSRSTLANQIST
jgi:hypothetical protein